MVTFSLRRVLQAAMLACVLLPPAALAAQTVKLSGHITPLVSAAVRLNHVGSGEKVSLALVLPLRNQADLNSLLERLYTPGDLLYGQFLTPDEFARQFGPTQADYNAVIAYAQSQGFKVTGTHGNRTIVDVVGSAQVVENAFALRLDSYQLQNGRVFQAPSNEPQIPVNLSGRLAAIVGLDTASVWHEHNVRLTPQNGNHSLFAPRQTGSGPGGGLTPSDIKTAYNLNGIGATGAGQSLALFELDGYKASDIAAYEAQYGLPNVPLQNVLIDGFSGAAGSGSGEVTLDIELQIAVAPGVNKVIVYEGPNSTAGVIDTYNRIATDNLAKSISTSWGLAENSSSSSTRNSESQAFQQMSAQGQSIFAAAGDSGAYDNGSTISVDDPASQPFMTGVGGTALKTVSAGGAWSSETTWNGGSISAGAGGGGISTVWAIPSYQSGVGSSTTNRNVPDVSLAADPNTGYSIYVNGAWNIYGGTSCAAPIWSGFVACVNQSRVAAGKGTLGFANTLIYSIGKGSRYATDFHDIADNSTNLSYHAIAGYDNATGWGTINGAGLFTDLVNGTSGTVTGGGTPTQLLGNPGFETGASVTPWVVSTGVINSTTSEAPHTGTWKAWLNGYGTAHTDTLYQQVSVPATITTASLTFWLHIDSAETSGSLANDTLKVQIRNAAGTVLATLATYSNLNKAAGYSQKTFNLAAYKGQTIQVYLIGVENGTKQTSFVVDDFALTVQ